MKELSIEEKAKAYDEAIERLRNAFYDNNSRMCEEYRKAVIKIIEPIFPQLKESEDERIRKAIIEHFEGSHSSTYPYKGFTKKQILAWLEKHCEQKSILPKWKYKSDNTPLLNDSIILNKYGCVAKSPSGALVSDVWVIDYDELVKLPKEELEKHNEQKPTDKVEPRFKVGDRIIKNSKKSCHVHSSTDDTICEVTEVHDTYYILNTKEGRIQEPFEWQDYYELVEQDWSEEDEKRARQIERIVHNAGCSRELQKQIADWLKSLKERVQPQQKQEWSEEDERIYKSITYAFVHNYPLTVQQREFVKSLEDRVQPQKHWKPTGAQLASLEIACDRNDRIGFELTELLKGLKKYGGCSMLPQWKPSDEQLTWLYRAADDASKDSRMKQVLNELLSDLKKLREK